MNRPLETYQFIQFDTPFGATRPWGHLLASAGGGPPGEEKPGTASGSRPARPHESEFCGGGGLRKLAPDVAGAGRNCLIRLCDSDREHFWFERFALVNPGTELSSVCAHTAILISMWGEEALIRLEPDTLLHRMSYYVSTWHDPPRT